MILLFSFRIGNSVGIGLSNVNTSSTRSFIASFLVLSFSIRRQHGPPSVERLRLLARIARSHFQWRCKSHLISLGLGAPEGRRCGLLHRVQLRRNSAGLQDAIRPSASRRSSSCHQSRILATLAGILLSPRTSNAAAPRAIRHPGSHVLQSHH